MPIHEIAQQIIDACDANIDLLNNGRIQMSVDFYKQCLRPVLQYVVEKDTPVHPVRVGFAWHCAKCKSPIQIRGRNRCPHCGQALTWEEEDDE